jgi:hypothetical protein
MIWSCGSRFHLSERDLLFTNNITVVTPSLDPLVRTNTPCNFFLQAGVFGTSSPRGQAVLWLANERNF